MHQSVSFHSFVFILIEKTKNAIVTASTLCRVYIILETGKGGGCKVSHIFKSSWNSFPNKKCYGWSDVQDV